jgi:chemotaxis protein histidine kinase CheA
MPTDVMEQMRGAFRAEALDLLIELDSALLALEAESADATLVHRVFRAIHTIKGSGATAGFAHLPGSLTRWKRPSIWRVRTGWP